MELNIYLTHLWSSNLSMKTITDLNINCHGLLVFFFFFSSSWIRHQACVTLKAASSVSQQFFSLVVCMLVIACLGYIYLATFLQRVPSVNERLENRTELTQTTSHHVHIEAQKYSSTRFSKLYLWLSRGISKTFGTHASIGNAKSGRKLHRQAKNHEKRTG